jgi:hypothetical protein
MTLKTLGSGPADSPLRAALSKVVGLGAFKGIHAL